MKRAAKHGLQWSQSLNSEYQRLLASGTSTNARVVEVGWSDYREWIIVRFPDGCLEDQSIEVSDSSLYSVAETVRVYYDPNKLDRFVTAQDPTSRGSSSR